jgi:thiol-disulfide isomerase/thioredoxin
MLCREPMYRTITLSLLFLALPLPLSASDEMWTPQRIPTTGAMPFVLYYQQFLRAKPFAIETQPRTPEEKDENRRRHQKAAEFYAVMAEVAQKLAQSGDLLPAAPASIKKEKSQLIVGTWNLYHNIPINAADLRSESLYMRYRALSHETSLDPSKIDVLHEFVAGLEKEASLQPLFQDLKRNICYRALSLVQKPIKDYRENTELAMPDESELGKKLSTSVEWFAPFVHAYPSEDNLKLVDPFLETVALFRSQYPDSECLYNIVNQFRNVFIDIQSRQSDSLIKEYAEVYEGVLRRQELLGKPMPIWGADLTGTPIEEKALEGKVVLLDFWATWCGPCLAEFPHLKLLYQKYKEKGFEIVSYNVDSEPERLHNYLARNPLPWIILSQESTERTGLPSLSRYYGAKSLPVVLLRDRAGKTLLIDARGEKLDEILETLFE